MSQPSLPVVIAVNQLATDVFIADTGLTVAASSQLNLHDYLDPHEIWGSVDLYAAVDAGDILINDGTSTLTQAESKRFLEIGLGHKVVNPGVSLDQQIPKFVGTTGKQITASNIKIDGYNQLDMGNARILNVATPLVSSDAVNKAYVDSIAGGQDWKESVRAATDGYITLSGNQTIDGVALVDGDRVLVKDQLDPTENGVYVVSSGAWTRAADVASGSEAAGAVVAVEEGTANADRAFICTNDGGSDLVGTDGLTFVYFLNSSLATSAPLDVDTGAASVGTSSRAAREDHKHDVATAAAGAVQIGDVAAEGSSLSLARADHVHSVASAAPVSVGTSNAEGSASTFSRSDHVHDLPFSAVQNALSEADGYVSLNGQLISNVADPISSGDVVTLSYFNANSTNVTNSAPVDVDASAAAVGTSDEAARADHKHDISTAAPTVGIGAGNSEGTSNSLARADHNHSLRESGGVELTLGAIGDGQMLYRDGYEIKGGTRLFAPSATDPVSPVPSAGDRYYNTALNLWMFYDASRSKFLSEETFEISVGRSGNTATGQYYRGPDGRPLSASEGWRAAFNGTIIGLQYTRTDSDAATFEVTAGGTTAASLASSATAGGSNALNGDFSQNAILACRNAAGGNDTSNVIASIRIKWRA